MIDENLSTQGPWEGGFRRERLDGWLSLVSGGALAAFGISRRSWTGAALAAAGAYLIYRGARGRAGTRPIHVQKTFTIMRPVDQVYAFWHDLSNLPKVMKHLRQVQTTSGRLSHWTLQPVLGVSLEWEAEITDQMPNEFLAWRTCPGSLIEHRGSVQFCSALDGEATEISVYMQYLPPAGRLGKALAAMFGQSPEQQIREDLRAAKALLETGEIPTTQGQPSGRRSVLVRTAKAAREFVSPAGTKGVRQPAAG